MYTLVFASQGLPQVLSSFSDLLLYNIPVPNLYLAAGTILLSLMILWVDWDHLSGSSAPCGINCSHLGAWLGWNMRDGLLTWLVFILSVGWELCWGFDQRAYPWLLQMAWASHSMVTGFLETVSQEQMFQEAGSKSYWFSCRWSPKLAPHVSATFYLLISHGTSPDSRIGEVKVYLSIGIVT